MGGFCGSGGDKEVLLFRLLGGEKSLLNRELFRFLSKDDEGAPKEEWQFCCCRGGQEQR